MGTRGFGRTDVGKRRFNNEDAFHVDDDLGLYVVADGVGSRPGGDVAAAAAVDAVDQVVARNRPLLESVRAGREKSESLLEVVDAAFAEAAEALRAVSDLQPNLRGLACTLTVVIAAGGEAVMGHLGVSRLYHRQRSKVLQVSRDHTWAAMLRSTGILSASEAAAHPYARHLTSLLTDGDPVACETAIVPLRPGDTLLLCTDGLGRYLTEGDWLARQMSRPDSASLVHGLVEWANAMGGLDNITAIVIEVESKPWFGARLWRRLARPRPSRFETAAQSHPA